MSTSDVFLAEGDLVEVFVKDVHTKGCTWSDPRTILAFDREAWTITVPERSVRTMNVAVDDVRPALET